MSRGKHMLWGLLAASVIMNVVLLMFLVGGRQAATVEQVPAGKNSDVETYKITGNTVMSGLARFGKGSRCCVRLRSAVSRRLTGR